MARKQLSPLNVPFRTGHTFALSGAVTAIALPGFFVPVATGQVVKLVEVRYKIGGGTSASFRLQKNGADITGFGTSGTPLVAATTAASTDPADETLADDDLITCVISAVSGSPTDLSVTAYLEHLI